MKTPRYKLLPIGTARQAQHALVGPLRGPAPSAAAESKGKSKRAQLEYNKIPAVYVVSVMLEGHKGAQKGGSEGLRPEPFMLYRITWACTGDVYPHVPIDVMGGAQSIHGRSVTIEWGDSFTKFMGKTPGLISAVFGDSNGFVDIPEGVLFGGSQVLEVQLTRLFWPADPKENPPTTVQFDFAFHGVGLLPEGVHASGSASSAE